MKHISYSYSSTGKKPLISICPALLAQFRKNKTASSLFFAFHYSSKCALPLCPISLFLQALDTIITACRSVLKCSLVQHNDRAHQSGCCRCREDKSRSFIDTGLQTSQNKAFSYFAV